MSTTMKRLAVSTRDSIPPDLRCVSFHGWPAQCADLVEVLSDF